MCEKLVDVFCYTNALYVRNSGKIFSIKEYANSKRGRLIILDEKCTILGRAQLMIGQNYFKKSFQ